MNSLVLLLCQDTSWSTQNHMFFHEFKYEFSIFHEFIYELWCKTFARTLPGTPEIMTFHEFMPDIMDFGHFQWKIPFWKSCLKNIVKNVVKNIVNLWKFSLNSGYCIVNSARSGWHHGSHSCCCCWAAAPEPPASLSAGMFCRIISGIVERCSLEQWKVEK